MQKNTSKITNRRADDEVPSNDAYHTAVTELEGLRDDIRVRIHLAGMELKQVWDDVDRRYLALRDAANGAKADALERARHGLVGIRTELRDLRERLDRLTRPEDEPKTS
jgi:hypothetical protein